MHIVSKVSLVSFAALAIAGPASAASTPVATVEAFHAALGRGDTTAVLALLAEDVLILEEGGGESSRAEYAAHHLAADAAYAKATRGTVARRTVKVAGDLAWVADEGRTTGQYKGKPVDRLTAETMVLRRAGDGWQVVHVHWSSRESPVKAKKS